MIQKLKKFNEILEEYGATVVYNNHYDSTTRSIINDTFFDRYVTDNDNFLRYFNRLNNIVEPKYTAGLLVEAKNYDPLITKLLEKSITDNKTNTSSKTDSTTESGTRAKTEGGTTRTKTDGTDTVNLEVDTTTTSSGTGSTTGSTDTTDSYTDTDNGSSRDLISNMPHSDVSSATTGNILGTVNWKYASAMTDHGTTDTKTHSGSSDVDTTSNTTTSGTDRTTGTNDTVDTIDTTEVITHGRTENITDGKTTSKTGSGSDESERTYDETLSGYEGVPSDLLEKARSFVWSTNSLEKLLDALEECFMSNLCEGGEYYDGR